MHPAWFILSYLASEVGSVILESAVDAAGQYSMQKIAEEMQKRGLEVDQDSFAGMFLQSAQDNMGALAFRAVQSTSMMATTKIISPIEDRSQQMKENIGREVKGQMSKAKNKVAKGLHKKKGRDWLGTQRKKEKEAMEMRLKMVNTSNTLAHNSVVGSAKINDSVNGKVANDMGTTVNVDMKKIEKLMQDLVNAKLA